jgi:two-component system sensor histidine kinase BaeS
MGLAIKWKVSTVRSLLMRVTIIFFTTTVAVVMGLMVVVNYQVSTHFNRYLNMSGMHGMGKHGNMMMMMGGPEQQFIASLQHSLVVVVFIMLLIGAIVSYYFARSITIPVIQLNRAVNAVSAGDLDTIVNVNSQDEVGQLAIAFNAMTAKLKSNTILRQRFLAGIAHELRTPLTILKANLEGIGDGLIEPDSEQIGSLTEEVDRLTKMVSDLKDLSLLEAGQRNPEFTIFNINLILRQVINKMGPVADEKNIELHLENSDTILLVWADAAMINQIAYNLIINGIRYTAPGGKVIVTVTKEESMARVTVRDTGIGIGTEDMEHIFDYFYRVDPARTKQSGGTGLGLAIVKQLVLIQGGQVGVTSALGQGSSFSFTIPRDLHENPIVSP